MTSPGVVRVRHSEDGWGVIDADATPGGCWAHYSFRAVEVWPEHQSPVRDQREVHGPSVGYRSTPTLAFDGDPGAGGDGSPAA